MMDFDKFDPSLHFLNDFTNRIDAFERTRKHWIHEVKNTGYLSLRILDPDTSIHKFSAFQAFLHVAANESDKNKFGYMHSKSASHNRLSLSFR